MHDGQRDILKIKKSQGVSLSWDLCLTLIEQIHLQNTDSEIIALNQFYDGNIGHVYGKRNYVIKTELIQKELLMCIGFLFVLIPSGII